MRFKFILLFIVAFFIFVAMAAPNQNPGMQLSIDNVQSNDLQIEISKNQIENTKNLIEKHYDIPEILVCILDYNLKNEIPNINFWQNSFDNYNKFYVNYKPDIFGTKNKFIDDV